jgi:hypothetical protein
MMDTLKKLAISAKDLTYTGPIVHPSCPALYRAFLLALTPDVVTNLIERIDALEYTAERARSVHKLIDQISKGVEDKLQMVTSSTMSSSNKQKIVNAKESQ